MKVEDQEIDVLARKPNQQLQMKVARAGKKKKNKKNNKKKNKQEAGFCRVAGRGRSDHP